MGIGDGRTHTRGGKQPGRLAGMVAMLIALLMVVLAAAVVVAGPRLLQMTFAFAAPPVVLAGNTPSDGTRQHMADDRRRLEIYGWVDKQAGIAHLPIDEAMQRMAQAGLLVGMPTDTAPVAATDAGDQATVPADVSFATHVLPILVEHCGECHGDDNPEEGLEVTSYRTLMLGSIYGAVIKAGDAEGSYLVEMVASGKMPKRGDKLTPIQIDTIRAWIDAGALDN